ncbi:MAG TPA: PepSY domain-containing protein [Dyella sp.]|nr:PepSY domain-containing protein [Dyella sp.]
MKKIASLTIAVALGCAGAAWAQEQDQALTKQEVIGDLTQQGYTDIHDVDFKDGVWTARARSGDGSRVKLRVDPVTGKAYPNKQVSRMEESDVRAMLSEQGYTHVHDLDFSHGVWTAKAKNPGGVRVSLQIDAQSGRIIGTN